MECSAHLANCAMIARMQKQACALIDPYWLGLAQGDLELALQAMLDAAFALPIPMHVARIYLYTESDAQEDAFHLSEASTLAVPLTVRVCGKDAIDDGYALVRAMDSEMHALAQALRVDALIVATMDDRLALSIERIKAQGLQVLGMRFKAQGTQGEAEDSWARMREVFDRILEPQLAPSVAPSSHGVSSEVRHLAAYGMQKAMSLDEQAGSATRGVAWSVAIAEAIAETIRQWLLEADEMTRDSTLSWMHARRGLPRFVDAKLLFFCKQILARELSEAEKFELRRRFREALQSQAMSDEQDSVHQD